MRKLIVIFLACVAAGIVATLTLHPDHRPMPEQFREAMNRTPYLTYADPDFGYSFYYPSFLRRDDQPHYGPGHVQFSYHVHTDIVLECRVEPVGSASDRRTRVTRRGQMAGLDGCLYYAQHVRRGHLWYILTLYYHADYEAALAGLRHHVRLWQPFGGPRISSQPRGQGHGKQRRALPSH